jgi:hypothetical protein
VIFQRLCHRIRQGVWDKSNGFTRQRQGHWLRALKRNILTYLGTAFRGDVLKGFYELIHAGKIPSLRPG